jgi:hypothetical protein
VDRVPGYKSRCPGFNLRRYQIFGEVVGLDRLRIIEELLARKSSDSGLENRD